jgi:hypothetical protein
MTEVMIKEFHQKGNRSGKYRKYRKYRNIRCSVPDVQRVNRICSVTMPNTLNFVILKMF